MAYSIDAGGTWNDGNDEAFVLPAGTYAIGAVQVKQQDSQGNDSAIAK